MFHSKSKVTRNPRLGSEILDKIVAEPVEQSGWVLLRHTKMRTPVDTGRLRASWSIETQKIGSLIVTVVYSNVEYGPYVESGTEHMRGRHMLAASVPDAAKWLSSRGFHVEFSAPTAII